MSVSQTRCVPNNICTIPLTDNDCWNILSNLLQPVYRKPFSIAEPLRNRGSAFKNIISPYHETYLYPDMPLATLLLVTI